MHISDVEKARMEKDHQMRHGYHVMHNKVFPHHTNDVNEKQYIAKDTENKHAAEMQPSGSSEAIPQNNYGPGAP